MVPLPPPPPPPPPRLIICSSLSRPETLSSYQGLLFVSSCRSFSLSTARVGLNVGSTLALNITGRRSTKYPSSPAQETCLYNQSSLLKDEEEAVATSSDWSNGNEHIPHCNINNIRKAENPPRQSIVSTPIVRRPIFPHSAVGVVAGRTAQEWFHAPTM